MTARSPRPFGIEEEYQLLDACSGTPIDRAADLIQATPQLRDRTEREFLSSQLETATPVCHEAEEAEESLTDYRQTISQAGLARGVVIAGTGLPPVGGDEVVTVTPKVRYRLIEAETREVAKHQYATGTHVHVEVPSPAAGIEVLAWLARWAPVLLAMTANSPLWCGEPTGFSSWRHIMALSWPVPGYPLGFADDDEYRRAVDQLVRTKVVPDAGMLSWVARLSQNYPTVELRIADAQLEAGEAVAFAAIVRALVDHALGEAEQGLERPRFSPAVVNGSNWLAARNGLGTEVIDPLEGEALPAFELIDRMLATIEPELDRFGDRARVDRYIARLREQGDPASRQLAAFEAGGVGAVLDLYRSGGFTAAAA